MIGIVCAFFHTEGKGFYSSRQLRLYSRGSADPRESLRRRRISKLALSAHKVLRQRNPGACRCVLAKNWIVDMFALAGVAGCKSPERRNGVEKGKYGKR